MQPGDIYVLTIVVTALAVAPFNALARIVVLAWIVAHVAYLAGAPELQINLVQHLAAFMVAARYLRTTSCLVAFALFVPMLTVDAIRLVGINGPFEWWMVLTLAFAQLCILPFGIDRAQVRALLKDGIAAYWAARPRDFLRVGA